MTEAKKCECGAVVVEGGQWSYWKAPTGKIGHDHKVTK